MTVEEASLLYIFEAPEDDIYYGRITPLVHRLTTQTSSIPPTNDAPLKASANHHHHILEFPKRLQ